MLTLAVLTFCLSSLTLFSYGLYSPPSINTTELTDENYKSLLHETDDLWLIYGYAPSSDACEKYASEFEGIVRGLQGVVKIGLLNAEEQQQLTEKFNIEKQPSITLVDSSLPLIKAYKDEFDKKNVLTFTLSVLREKMEKQAGTFEESESRGQVVELTDDSFGWKVLESENPWLIQFYAPWCSNCQKFGPEYVKVARELKNEIKCGAVDVTNNRILAERYDIRYFPTIKYFPAGLIRKESPKAYRHFLTKNAVIQWARLMNSDLPIRSVEMIKEDALKTTCEKAPLCIISFLPCILDCQAKCRNEYLNITSVAAEKFRSNWWGWLWSEGGKQIYLERALKVGGSSGYPAMVAFNIRQLTYYALKGPYTVKNIRDFLKAVSTGKWEVSRMNQTNLPEIVKAIPWDGQDAHVIIQPGYEFASKLLERDEL